MARRDGQLDDEPLHGGRAAQRFHAVAGTVDITIAGGERNSAVLVGMPRFERVAGGVARRLHEHVSPLVDIERQGRADAVDEGLQQRHDACGLGVGDACKLRLHPADEVFDVQRVLQRELDVADGDDGACACRVESGAELDALHRRLTEGEDKLEVLHIGQARDARLLESLTEHAEHGVDERLVDVDADVVLRKVDAEGDADGLTRLGFAARLVARLVAFRSGDGAGVYVLLLISEADIGAEQARDALELDLAEPQAARVDVDRVAERLDIARDVAGAEVIDVACLDQPGGAEIVHLEDGGVEGRAQRDRHAQVAEQDAADAGRDDGAEVEVRLDLDAEVDRAGSEGRLDHRRAVILRAGGESRHGRRVSAVLLLGVIAAAVLRDLAHFGVDGGARLFRLCLIHDVDGPAVFVVFGVGRVVCRHEEAVGTQHIREQPDHPACERAVVALFGFGIAFRSAPGVRVVRNGRHQTFAGHGDVDVRRRGEREVVRDLARRDVEDRLVHFIQRIGDVVGGVELLGADVELDDVERHAEVLGHLEAEREQAAVLPVAEGLDADVAEVGQLEVDGDVGVVRAHLGEDGVHRRERQLQREVARVDDCREISIVVQGHARRGRDARRHSRFAGSHRAAEHSAERLGEELGDTEVADLRLDVSHARAEHAREVDVDAVAREDDAEDGLFAALDLELHLQLAREVEVGVELHREVRLILAAEVVHDVERKVGADKRRVTQLVLDRIDAEDHVHKLARVDRRAVVAPEAELYLGVQPDAGRFRPRRGRGDQAREAVDVLVLRREGTVDRDPEVAELQREVDVRKRDIFALDHGRVERVSLLHGDFAVLKLGELHVRRDGHELARIS